MSKVYVPGYVSSPENPTAFQSDFEREQYEIKFAIDDLQDRITDKIRFEAPPKPFVFQVVFADGVKWDPGSGVGLYFNEPVLDADGKTTSTKWTKLH